MSEPTLALQGAYRQALGGDPVVAADVGDRIFDRVKPDAAFPFIRIGDDQFVGEDQTCLLESGEVFSSVHVFSRAVGKVEAKRIAGNVMRCLTLTPLVLDGDYSLLSILHVQTRFLDEPDGLGTHAVVEFRALIDGAN